MKEPRTERLGTCRECGRGIYWDRDRGIDLLQRAQVVCKHCARDAAKVMAEAAERRWISETYQREKLEASKAHLRRQKKLNAELQEVA